MTPTDLKNILEVGRQLREADKTITDPRKELNRAWDRLDPKFKLEEGQK